MKKFSELLKMFREESGFSKTDLSEKIGLKRPNYIIDIETGGRKPPQPSTLQKIITALQLDPEEATELRAAAERERIPQEFIHLIEKHQTSMGLQTDIQAALSPRGLVQIPLLGQCPASPKSITEGEIEAYYWFPKKVVGGRRLYLLRADGDSMNKADINIFGDLKALIVPHAGYVYSGPVAAYGYKLLKKTDAKRIILIGPSHNDFFDAAMQDENDYWQSPFGKIKLEKTDKLPLSSVIHKQEHSLEVQLPFLQLSLKNFTLMPILIADADPRKTAEIIESLLDNSTIIIASSDLSHYHSYDNAFQIDKLANEAIPKLDIKSAEKIEACGKIPILILMHIAKKMGWKAKKLIYKNSGDVVKDRESVVGYGCYAFYR